MASDKIPRIHRVGRPILYKGYINDRKVGKN